MNIIIFEVVWYCCLEDVRYELFFLNIFLKIVIYIDFFNSLERKCIFLDLEVVFILVWWRKECYWEI